MAVYVLSSLTANSRLHGRTTSASGGSASSSRQRSRSSSESKESGSEYEEDVSEHSPNTKRCKQLPVTSDDCRAMAKYMAERKLKGAWGTDYTEWNRFAARPEVRGKRSSLCLRSKLCASSSHPRIWRARANHGIIFRGDMIQASHIYFLRCTFGSLSVVSHRHSNLLPGVPCREEAP